MPVQISGRELVKALSKDGWETVSVPVHGNHPLPAGTLASICRSVGRTASELRSLI